MPDDHPQSNHSHEAPIPKGLRKQLDAFKKELWKIKIIEAVLAGFFGLIFSFLLVFGLDRIMETPNSIRLIILLLGISIFSIFAPYWIRRWVYGHRHENQLARLIARRFPRLGDRMLGAVELQDQTESADVLSPQLRAAAMRTVAADAANKDLLEALPIARHRKGALIVTALLLVAAATIITVPDAGFNALKRWLMPLSDTERYTFTKLDLSGIKTPHHVPYGESFSLTIPLAADSNRQPDIARARYGQGDWVEAQLDNGSYTFTFAGQRAQDRLYLEADDARHSLPVEPRMRPSMENSRAAIKLPAYLERPDVSADLRSGFLSVLEGSEILIQSTMSSALQSASGKLTTLPKEVAELDNSAPLEDPAAQDGEADTRTADSDQSAATETETAPLPEKDLSLKVNGRKITTSAIPMADHPLLATLQWTDIFGLAGDAELKIRLESSQDQPPSTYIQGIERQHIMLAEETLDFEVLAEDDYGLKAAGISWQGEFTKPTGETPAQGELLLKKGNPTLTSLTQKFSFSPQNLEIKPQKLILRSWTEDYNPKRKRVYSEPIVIYILTRDEHAQVLKNQFDRAIGELEDIARKEQNLNDENQRLDRKEGQDLQNEDNKKKLQAQQDAERENKERLEKLTKDMEQLFKDAVRNGEIDKEALQKMGKALENMKEITKENLPKVEQKLQDAQSQRNTPEKTKQDLKEAIEEQEKALEKMKQALKDANEANRNFEASTFVNRLKRAATEEDGIASTFIDAIDKVIGSEYEDLDPVEQRSVKSAYDQQRQTASDVRWIQEDLGHYFARTQKPEHEKLVNEMRSSQIDQAMEVLSNQVASNLSYNSISQSKRWAAQLRKWAKELDGSKKSGGGGGGGGGGQPPQEDKDFEFMLKVMRMIQKEQDIRSRTRALEDLKRSLELNQ